MWTVGLYLAATFSYLHERNKDTISSFQFYILKKYKSSNFTYFNFFLTDVFCFHFQERDKGEVYFVSIEAREKLGKS